MSIYDSYIPTYHFNLKFYDYPCSISKHERLTSAFGFALQNRFGQTVDLGHAYNNIFDNVCRKVYFGEIGDGGKAHFGTNFFKESNKIYGDGEKTSALNDLDGSVAGQPAILIPAQYINLIEDDKCDWNSTYNCFICDKEYNYIVGDHKTQRSHIAGSNTINDDHVYSMEFQQVSKFNPQQPEPGLRMRGAVLPPNVKFTPNFRANQR